MLKEHVPFTGDWKSSVSVCVQGRRCVFVTLAVHPCVKVCTCVFLWSATGTDMGPQQVTGPRLL